MQQNVENIFLRNYGVISHEEQQKLTNARVTVVGAGGVGGMTLISLARMGVGHIHVVDMDIFEASNMNRQMLCGVSRIGKSKALSAEETLRDINPNIQVTVTQEKLTEENAKTLLTHSDVVVDATDNLVSRVIIHRTAQQLHIPSVWIAVTPPFRGAVMTFSHETPDYELVLQHPSHGQALTDDVKAAIGDIKNKRARFSATQGALSDWSEAFIKGEAPWAVLCPVANIVGIMASFEVFKVILDRPTLPPCYAPQLIKINLAAATMVQILTSESGSWNNVEL